MMPRKMTMACFGVSTQRWLLLLGVLFLTGCARSDALWGVVDKLCMANYQQSAIRPRVSRFICRRGKRRVLVCCKTRVTLSLHSGADGAAFRH